MNNPKSALIIGIAGGLAQVTLNLLKRSYPNLAVVGVDSRATAHLPKKFNDHKNISFKTIKYSRGNFENIFRENKFDIVIQLGRLSHKNVGDQESLSQRLDINVMGTKKILDLSLKFKVKKVILMSTYHVYGALSSNPVFMNEDQPLRASIVYPELRDVVEMDQLASNWMWKNQQAIDTVILRPCTIVGSKIHNLMMKYLQTSYAPICSDFNPMFQFIHEYDMAMTIINAIGKLPTGIYNVAPDECISLRQAKVTLDVEVMPIPSFILLAAVKLVSNTLWHFPEYMLAYIKYSCIIDNTLLKESYSGQELFKYSTREALELSQLE